MSYLLPSYLVPPTKINYGIPTHKQPCRIPHHFLATPQELGGELGGELGWEIEWELAVELRVELG